VRTAGPQPGTFPAQCALLDLNLGPAQLKKVGEESWQRAWRRVGKAEIQIEINPDMVEEKLEEEARRRTRRKRTASRGGGGGGGGRAL